MANNLTGVYEAVLQVSVRQLNGLLATLHQNGAKGSGLSPSFPHSVPNLRVGDRPLYLGIETSQFANWLSGAVQSFQSSGGPPVTAAELAAKAPPGARTRFLESLAGLDAAWNEPVTPGVVRGRAEVQVSTPTISLPPGSTSEVIVSVEIRARFIPDDGWAALREPIHGELHITYQVRPMTLPNFVNAAGNLVAGKRVLTIEVPAQDNKIVVNLAGLADPADVAALTARIRAAVRKEFKPEPVDLPADFQFFEFKEVGGGQAIAIPVQLSDAEAPAGAINSVTNLFLGSGPSQSDFAIAVSKDYVESKLKPALDKLRQIQDFIPLSLPDLLPTYRISVTSATLLWNNGWIDLKITAKATTPHEIAPDFENISIDQRLTLALDAAQTVSLQAPDSDLTISGVVIEVLGEEYDLSGVLKSFVISQRNAALAPAQADIKHSLGNARIQLSNALHSFDKSLDGSFPPRPLASYTAVDVKPVGIIVRGAIGTKDHYQPQMAIGYTEDGKSYTAFNCWIPGGTIKTFTWTYEEGPPLQALLQKATHETFSDSFTFPLSKVIKPGSWATAVCLTIGGTQVDANGKIDGVTGTEQTGTCEISFRELPLVVNPLKEALIGVHWLPTPVPLDGILLDGILEEAISAHINVLAHPRPAGGLTTNALVHFAGARPARPLEALGRALTAMRRQNVSLTLVLVMPVGTFRHRRGEVEEMLGSLGERFTGSLGERSIPTLLITEDYVGGWTRTFDARNTPASYLMNARGEFVWKQEERLDVEALTAAMDEHFLPAPAARALPLRLTVRPGERAPDALFEEGHGLALHRLRGQHVLLNFWQSWSAPCIRELRRLQRLHEEGGGRAPVILAVNGGEERTLLAAVRRQHNLTFTLIRDAGQRIARLYGVHCWPTTVSINPDGIVDRIQFGITHEHRSTREGKEAEAY